MIFTDVYGEVIKWRVAAAVIVVAIIAVLVAFPDIIPSGESTENNPNPTFGSGDSNKNMLIDPGETLEVYHGVILSVSSDCIPEYYCAVAMLDMRETTEPIKYPITAGEFIEGNAFEGNGKYVNDILTFREMGYAMNEELGEDGY